MPAEIYITASAAISRQRILKNEIAVFENTAGDAPAFLLAAYHHLGIKYPKFYKMDNLSKSGLIAAEVLLKDNFEAARYKPEDIGIVLMNASASLDADLKYFETAGEFASPALFVYTLPNIVIGEISIKHKVKGENAFFIFEAFDASFMQKYVGNLINNNTLQACICGWVEWIGAEYMTVLFLVEKEGQEGNNILENKQPEWMLFTPDNLNKIYYSKNG